MLLGCRLLVGRVLLVWTLVVIIVGVERRGKREAGVKSFAVA